MSGENSCKNGGSRRLPSFKAQRDLTLGATQKNNTSKKFVPNLNVRRKTTANAAQSDPELEAKSTSSSQKKDHHNNKSNDLRKKPQLIQMDSVFSEGTFESTKKQFRSGGSSGSSRAATDELLEKPRPKYPKDELENELEKERLKNLLRDDFIEDIKVGGTPPIQLPMIQTGNMFKDEDISEVKIEGQKKKYANVVPDDDKLTPKVIKSVQDFMQSPENTDLFLVQLPDMLPGEKTIGSVGDGKLGTIEVRQSGQTRFILENGNELDLELGTQVGFLQDAVSVKLDEQTEDAPSIVGDMTVLGQVIHRLVVTPSWEALLRKSGNVDDS
ncbi:DNA-directed RNA polymerase III subunit RPC4 [Lepeophtheirus salmonis]|uniref:DNA-directed RNA polymerase III subunit RPC4 n=1 Tax=Lepeophtheirus salmonis TaxID=72036 RepID=UPI001AE6F2DD|nr:DNA-directed RNA polymerase III subunit RPC4-like [Lepeophtheirus salmonis]XP_040566645.1 DNA-directed RNA polymerase III subunit RPC4-like [Lepeophtheirus salmonis]XP_040566646.1 DNA-directed RNA polymerase III subunit RPC4-like [Lepeophtheirus salmonis]